RNEGAQRPVKFLLYRTTAGFSRDSAALKMKRMPRRRAGSRMMGPKGSHLGEVVELSDHPVACGLCISL
ncbi:hypothetical protein, partial [Amycolatopsis bartoniae]|uniref:hypothetical protein n=1 Tax=Amycolatopsis bartoniae TaxID=941986 RepID=UPI001C9885B9